MWEETAIRPIKLNPMKKLLFFLMATIFFGSCKKEIVEKPSKLIDEDKMVDIIYDLTVMEAIKSEVMLQSKPLNQREYIYKKYHIDSLQFAQSNHYYASDIANYKKIYEKVSNKIEAEQKQAEAQAMKSGALPVPTSANADAPQVK